MHRFTLVYFSAAAFSCAAVAGEVPHAGDINPSVLPIGAPEDGMMKIQTNGIDNQGEIVANLRIFAADFGDSGFPQFTANPGFDALPSTFTPGTRVGFHAPEGFLVFSGEALAPVSTERLNVKFLTLQVNIGAAPSAGFDLAVQANGGWHRHLSYTISDTTLPLPVPGIYVLPMTLYSTDPSVLESDLFWMVFDYQMGQEAQDDAMTWIASHLLAPVCPGDLDADSIVGPSDLATLLGAWGSRGAADLDSDGAVGPADLAIILGSWGSCD
ncbi:MAG: hypothetical protein SGJ09_00150 [Phycisphaerae bacterium]|nr:hypothetical protein [Phycisphaerae bacterium]